MASHAMARRRNAGVRKGDDLRAAIAAGAQSVEVDYALMEDYQLASVAPAGTAIAVTSAAGDAWSEIFTFSSDAVTRIAASADSRTGWATTALPAFTGAGDIQCIAAAAVPSGATEGCRVVCVGTDAGQVYAVMEATAGQGDWGAWVGISTGGGAAIASPVMRLRIDAAGSQLKLTAMALVTDYGGVCDLYQPYSGTLYADGGLAWDLAALPQTGLPLSTWIASPNPMLYVWVTPSLIVYEQSAYVDAPVWSTDAGWYAENGPQVSIWRPNPAEPGTFVIGDVAIPGVDGPPSQPVLCAASIADPSGTTPAMLVAADGLDVAWSSDATDTGNHGSLSTPTYAAGGYAAMGWVADPSQHHPTLSHGQLVFDGVAASLAMVSSAVLGGSTAPVDASQSIWCTVNGHAKYPMSLWNIRNADDSADVGDLYLQNSTTPPTGVATPFLQSGVYTADTLVGRYGPSPYGPFGSSTPCALNIGALSNGAVIQGAGGGSDLWFAGVTQSDGALHVGRSDGADVTWAPATSATGFLPASKAGGTTLELALDVAGNLHVFALGPEGLYHAGVAAGADVSTLSTPEPILDGVESFELCPAAGQANPRLVAMIGGSAPRLVHLALNDDGWAPTEIDLQDLSTQNADFRQVNAYTTTIRAMAADGTPMANAALHLTPDVTGYMMVNGAGIRFLGGQASAVTTDASGCLHVTWPASSLAAPLLRLSTSSDDDAPIATVIPSRNVAKTLQTISVGDVESGLGQPSEAAGQIVPALNRLGAMVETAAGTAGLSAVESNVVTPLVRRGRSERRRLGNGVSDSAWSISFDADGAPSFDDDDAAVRARAARRRRDLPRLAAVGGLSPIALFSDAMSFISHEAHSLVECAVEIADGLVTLTLTLADATAAYVQTQVMAISELIGAALSLVGAILTQVGAALTQVIEWLSYLFDWDDIKQVHDALQSATVTLFEAAKASIAGWRTNFDDKIDACKASFDTQIEAAIASRGDEKVSSLRVTSADMDDMNLVPSHLMTNGVRNFSGQTAISGFSGGTDLSALQASIQSNLGGLSGDAGVQAEFQKLFDDAFSSMEALAEASFALILQGCKVVVDGVLDLVRTFIDAVCSAIEAALDALIHFLQHTKLSIPWVSDLYAAKMGEQMTILGAMCLLPAIPGVVILKALTSVAGEPVDLSFSLSDFNTGFTAARIESAIGGGSTEAALDARPLPRTARLALTAVAAACSVGALALAHVSDPVIDTLAWADVLGKEADPTGLVAKAFGLVGLASMVAGLTGGVASFVATFEGPTAATALTALALIAGAVNVGVNASLTAISWAKAAVGGLFGPVLMLQLDPGIGGQIAISSVLGMLDFLAATASENPIAVGMVLGGFVKTVSDVCLLKAFAVPQPELLAIPILASGVIDIGKIGPTVFLGVQAIDKLLDESDADAAPRR